MTPTRRVIAMVALVAAAPLSISCGEDVEATCNKIAENELKVFSNNVGIFPAYILALYPDGLKEKKAKIIKDEEKRAQLLAKALIEYEGDPDVLLLQEIWSIKARDALIIELAKKYPFYAYQPGVNTALQPSGLMVFSKYKLNDFKFKEFTKGEGLDKLSQKGIVGVRLVKDGRDIAVFVTHLQAGGKDKTIRPDQLRESNEFISGFTKGRKNMVAIMAGDFNIASNKSGYQTIFDKLAGAADTYKAECSVLKKSARYDDDPAKRIDYLLTFHGVKAISTIVDPAGETISDHLAVFGIVSLGSPL